MVPTAACRGRSGSPPCCDVVGGALRTPSGVAARPPPSRVSNLSLRRVGCTTPSVPSTSDRGRSPSAPSPEPTDRALRPVRHTASRRWRFHCSLSPSYTPRFFSTRPATWSPPFVLLPLRPARSRPHTIRARSRDRLVITNRRTGHLPSTKHSFGVTGFHVAPVEHKRPTPSTLSIHPPCLLASHPP
jgi:hypothetical protein